jgi:hypothetical protein
MPTRDFRPDSMPYHNETITRRVHLLPSSQAPDVASALALVKSGSVNPSHEKTKVQTRKVRSRRPPSKAPAPVDFLHRVVTTERTIHSIPEADASDKTAAATLAASGTLVPAQQISSATAIRLAIRPKPVKKSALVPKPA